MLLYFFSIVLSCFSFDNALPPRVKTSYGWLEGYSAVARNGKLTYVYKSVPFAAPPLGNLRWRKPTNPFKWNGIKNATTYSAACMSKSTVSTSPQSWVDEDCLYQNIFVPASCTEKHQCPVVFYLHGGGMNYDSAVMFNDEFLINNFGGNDVILVITAFRLGFTALLTFDDDSVVPRNLAIYDVLQSLEFCQNEIKHFGGNPKKVTLMGHSMGGALVHLLSLSKAINIDKRLFQRSMALSGPYASNYDVEKLKNTTSLFISRTGCYPDQNTPRSGPELQGIMKCLREKDGQELLQLQYELELNNYNDRFEGILMIEPLFPETPGQNDFLLNVPKIDLVLGTTYSEFDYFRDTANPGRLLHLENQAEILTKYKSDRFDKILQYNHTLDTEIIWLENYLIAHAARHSDSTVYLYSYDYPKHSRHTDDMYYLMGIHPFEMDENEKILAQIYPHYFLNFAKNGVPDEHWIPMNSKWDNFFSINVSVTDNVWPKNKPFYHADVISYWLLKIPKLDRMISSFKNSLSIVEARDLVTSNTASQGNAFATIAYSVLALAIVGSIYYTSTIIRKRMQRSQFEILQ